MPASLSESAAALDAEALGERLRQVFQRIETTRMRGLPILHPGLAVEVVGGRLHEGDWVGVLVTPWCMNLVLVPGRDAAARLGLVGAKRTFALPAGAIEFLTSEEADIGPFAACSLFSPMGDFPDQTSAVAAGASILETLFTPDSDGVSGDEAGSSASQGPGISRRDLLRSLFRAE